MWAAVVRQVNGTWEGAGNGGENEWKDSSKVVRKLLNENIRSIFMTMETYKEGTMSTDDF